MFWVNVVVLQLFPIDSFRIHLYRLGILSNPHDDSTFLLEDFLKPIASYFQCLSQGEKCFPERESTKKQSEN